jgi:2-haloacid dehalogenase
VPELPEGSAILFDLAGVLIRWDPRNLYRKIFVDDPEGMEHFLSTVCTPAWVAEQDRGRPFRDGIRLLVERFPRYREHIEAFRERWAEMLGGEITENTGLFREIVASGHPVFALSNWSAETFPVALHHFPFLRDFSGIVISGTEKCVKPSPEIFAVAQRKFSLVPARTAFIDDTRVNYHGARRLGYDAIHYRSPDQLRRELTARGWVAGEPR